MCCAARRSAPPGRIEWVLLNTSKFQSAILPRHQRRLQFLLHHAVARTAPKRAPVRASIARDRMTGNSCRINAASAAASSALLWLQQPEPSTWISRTLSGAIRSIFEDARAIGIDALRMRPHRHLPSTKAVPLQATARSRATDRPGIDRLAGLCPRRRAIATPVIVESCEGR